MTNVAKLTASWLTNRDIERRSGEEVHKEGRLSSRCMGSILPLCLVRLHKQNNARLPFEQAGRWPVGYMWH